MTSGILSRDQQPLQTDYDAQQHSLHHPDEGAAHLQAALMDALQNSPVVGMTKSSRRHPDDRRVFRCRRTAVRPTPPATSTRSWTTTRMLRERSLPTAGPSRRTGLTKCRASARRCCTWTARYSMGKRSFPMLYDSRIRWTARSRLLTLCQNSQKTCSPSTSR